MVSGIRVPKRAWSMLLRKITAILKSTNSFFVCHVARVMDQLDRV